MSKQTKLPPGRYRIGDPSHILTNRDYKDWLDGGRTVKRKIRGQKFVALPTIAVGCHDFRRGDTHISGPIGVDSGHVAAVPVGLVRADAGMATMEVEFGERFACQARGSLLCFGDVRVMMW